MEVNLYNTNKKYNVIYADPPWSYQQWCDKKQGAAKAHYETMKQKDIEELPVERIADKNCILFMWATFPKLQEALATIKAWGFEYKTIGFCWVKRNKNGSWFKGIGFYTKSNSEVCLIATKGKPPKKSVHHTVSAFDDYDRENGYEDEDEQPEENQWKVCGEIVDRVVKIAIRLLKNSYSQCMKENIVTLLDYLKFELDTINENQ